MRGDLLFSADVYKSETRRGATKINNKMTVQNLQKSLENFRIDDKSCFVNSC